MQRPLFSDWGEASEAFDEIASYVASRDLAAANEAQTRFDVIDRLVRDVWGWRYGQINLEEPTEGPRAGYVDYLLRVGDHVIVVEAKKAGSAFPTPSRKSRLKLSGSVLGSGEVAQAIKQAREYAKDKGAEVLVVTNGLCWCFFSVEDSGPEAYAYLLFPFSDPSHAQALFEFFSELKVERGSLERITNQLPRTEDRLLAVLRDADGRVDRNNIADHILPALNSALYAEALLSNVDALDKCFVITEARSKFDAQLGMHLSDPKPNTVLPAKRIKTGKEHGPLKQIVEQSSPGFAPPVTLIIGPVGAGKSTYLKHFELIAGRELLSGQKAHWVYIDFEEMGRAGSPRSFLYEKLRTYLLADHPASPTDYKHLVEPAYEEEIAGLARGPLAPIFTNKPEYSRRVTDYIQKDFEAIEPYVDKLLKYLAKSTLCVLVLDNIDLYEDESLETAVFAEGLALSKRVHCHVIVSIRDKTFVRHRADSAFDAYELRKLWLDPPPFKAVLSSRLTYARKILEGHYAKILLANGMYLTVPDLSVFFDIVQRSILQGQAGEYVEAISDLNIRRGLSLVTNFLTSGHIQADRAIKSYVDGNTKYYFPFHEIFKGTMLGQWKHYREDRSDCVNLFDSRLGAHSLRLLRLHILTHLLARAQREESLEVPVTECIELFSSYGASEAHVLTCLVQLNNHGLVRSVTAEDIDQGSRVVATRSGGYYAKVLSHKFVFAETCMLDTAIEQQEIWDGLVDLTNRIESEGSIARRMELRADRIGQFLKYLSQIEGDVLAGVDGLRHVTCMDALRAGVMDDANQAVYTAKRYYA